jgi:hypothetical protein
MALILADRVQELTTTTGLVDFSLTGATQNFQSFNTGIGIGNTCYYFAAQSDASLNQWEVGVGTLSDATTLQRTTILSSSTGGSKINFSAGAKLVAVTLPASRAVYENAAGIPPYETDNESVAIAIVMG